MRDEALGWMGAQQSGEDTGSWPVGLRGSVMGLSDGVLGPRDSLCAQA